MAKNVNFKPCSMQTLSVWKTLKFVVWERVKKRTPQSMQFDLPSTLSATLLQSGKKLIQQINAEV